MDALKNPSLEQIRVAKWRAALKVADKISALRQEREALMDMVGFDAIRNLRDAEEEALKKEITTLRAHVSVEASKLGSTPIARGPLDGPSCVAKKLLHKSVTKTSVDPAPTATSSDTMTRAEWSKLAPLKKQEFFRKGGRLV